MYQKMGIQVGVRRTLCCDSVSLYPFDGKMTSPIPGEFDLTYGVDQTEEQ